MKWKPPNLGLTYKTSESVSPGHPDKLADTMADAVLDACLGQDHSSRVACEVLISGSHVVVAGEISSRHKIQDHLRELVIGVVNGAGYRNPAWGFDTKNCEIISLLRSQSPDIDQCVTGQEDQLKAGDQSVVFGYACAENRELMPSPQHLAHRLMRSHASLVRTGRIPWLGPDAKAQVTVVYQDGRARAIDSIVVSTQHESTISQDLVEDTVQRSIIQPSIPQSLCDLSTRTYINPSGRFVIGGPAADTGLTGRKSVADTYGSACPHGGGALCGKDPTKVDRSGAYMARYVAKNIVGAGLASRCTVQLTYIIGRPDPVAVDLDLHDADTVDPVRLTTLVKELFDFTPQSIIKSLALNRPIYRPTATFGHFGRLEPGFTWERLDRVAELREACGLSPKLA